MPVLGVVMITYCMVLNLYDSVINYTEIPESADQQFESRDNLSGFTMVWIRALYYLRWGGHFFPEEREGAGAGQWKCIAKRFD